MQSPCIREASTCFHGFCTNPYFDRLDSQSSTTRSTATSQHDFANSTNSSLYPNTRFTNHESLPSLAELFSNFTKAYPQYLKTHQADQIRVQEYYHLSNHVCFDYIGHVIWPETKPSLCNFSCLYINFCSFNTVFNWFWCALLSYFKQVSKFVL